MLARCRNARLQLGTPESCRLTLDLAGDPSFKEPNSQQALDSELWLVFFFWGMEEALAELMSQFPWWGLAVVIVVSIAGLGKGADWLVDEAVALSERSGVPKVVIGATIVSLGTTTPEAVVSVLAAVQGKPGLAMGNAVGSIICDTGLILGIASLISPPLLDRAIVNRQGWVQFGAGWLLVVTCFPWSNMGQVFSEGGGMPQAAGFFFLALLATYLYLSVRWARKGRDSTGEIEEPGNLSEEATRSPAVILAKLAGAILLVVAASWILIPAVSDAARRMSIPESMIAATLVAFGTSLPELVTAVSAARRGHGELAVGNVVGADILNVLFVAGAAAAVTSGGLQAPSHFFTLYFPCMLLILTVFRIGIYYSGDRLRKPFAVILLATYVLVTVLSYVGR